jgi:hypothetical protein
MLSLPAEALAKAGLSFFLPIPQELFAASLLLFKEKVPEGRLRSEGCHAFRVTGCVYYY